MAGIIAGIGLAITAASTGMSFLQAGKQRKAEDRANREAAKAMAAARKKLEVNYLDALGIQKEPYELEREALLVAGAQGVEAARESERGAAAGVGRIQLAQQKGQAGIRTAMGQEMSALDRAAAAEESRLRDVGVQLDLGEVAGAQMAASDASQAAAAAKRQGFQSLASFGAQAAAMAPLFSQSQGVKDFNKAQRAALGKARQDTGKGFLGIGTGIDRQAVKNKFMLERLNKADSGFDMDRFAKLAGKQGLSSFNEKEFEANPQAYMGRGSVQQQAYLQNLLYGTPMNVGGPIEDEEDEFVVEEENNVNPGVGAFSSNYGVPSMGFGFN